MKVSELQKQTPRTLATKVHQRELRIEYLENRIAVLEANHKIQADINAKAVEYISELEKALGSSIKLNKAQADRSRDERGL